MVKDIRKYILTFKLLDSSKGNLNDPERIERINKVVQEDKRVIEIIGIAKDYFILEVQCENGTLHTFKMHFSKKLLAFDEFYELSILRNERRRGLFSITQQKSL